MQTSNNESGELNWFHPPEPQQIQKVFDFTKIPTMVGTKRYSIQLFTFSRDLNTIFGKRAILRVIR